MNIFKEVFWWIFGINDLEREIKRNKWDIEALLFLISELNSDISEEQIRIIRVKWGKEYPEATERNIRGLETLHKFKER